MPPDAAPLDARPRSQDRADRSGWRRPMGSLERWQLVLSLPNATAGEVWQEMQRQAFLSVSAADDLSTEWEYVVTLAGEMPPEDSSLALRRGRERSSTYMDRMMRARGR